MGIFKKLGWFFKQEKKTYIIGVVSLLTVSVLQLIPPRVIGIIVDLIDQKAITVQKVFLWCGLLIVVAILQYLFRYIWRTHIWGGAARLEKGLRRQLFHHFTMMDNVFFQEHRTGDLMAHATNDLTAVQNVAGAGILTFADSFITGAMTIVAMIWVVDWRLTILALLPFPLLAVTSRVLGNKLHHAFRDLQAAFSDVNDKVQESITGIKVIKTFGQEKEDIAHFNQKITAQVKKEKKVNFLDALFDPFITFIIGLSYILTIIVGGHLIMQKQISIGQMVSFVNYIAMLVWPMFAIGRLFNVLERGNASYDRVQELLKKKTNIHERKNPVTTPAKGNLLYHIESFHYPKDETFELKQIQFELLEGQTLGLVGRTGSGKTTILKLILREYDAYRGEIIFGRHNIKDYSLDALLGSIGYVPQDHFLFSMTIRDNIRFANPSASQEEVEKVARLTAIHEDILQFPDGYDTMVGERGVSLSGGQKQRISIARALLLDPELLILDDALSAVDAKTEEKILSNLKAVRGNKSTIISAHRLSSVNHAKEIIVVDEGNIIERGNHDALMAQAGWYHKMYEQQQLEAKIERGQ